MNAPRNIKEFRKNSCAIAFIMAMSAFVSTAAPWFDAGVSEYESWPDDGSDKVMTGVGTWSGTGGADLASGADGSRLNIDTSYDSPLVFGAAVKSDMPIVKRKFSRPIHWLPHMPLNMLKS